MRVFCIVCYVALLTIGIAGCGQTESQDSVVSIDALVNVDLTHVDPEVLEFLSRKQRNVRESPNSSSAIGELAMAYEMNGFADSALIGYQRAATLSPTNIKWSYFEGLVLASFGDYEGALAALERALTIDATYAPGWIWKGRWHLELDELPEAASAFHNALAIDAHAAATIGLAQVALREDQTEVAMTYLQNLRQRVSHPQIDHLIRTAQARIGLADDVPLTQRTEIPGQIGFPDPLSAEKRTYEVSISAELTRFRELLAQPDRQSSAFAIIDSIFEKHPDNKRVVIAKVHRLRLEGDVTQLRLLLEKAHRTWPSEINFMLGLAELEITSQNSSEALRLLDEALTLEPDNPWGLLQHGIALAQSGDFSEAISSLQRALQVDETAETHFYLGHAYAEFEDFVNARCHMKRAVELAPEFVQAAEQLERLDAKQRHDSPSETQIENCGWLTDN